jgi:hypothetical protein
VGRVGLETINSPVRPQPHHQNNDNTQEKPMKLHHIMILSLVAAALGDIILLKYNRSEEDAWETYRVEHHCTPVGHTDGSNRAGYQCDDGQVHYRWRQMR